MVVSTCCFSLFLILNGAKRVRHSILVAIFVLLFPVIARCGELKGGKASSNSGKPPLSVDSTQRAGLESDIAVLSATVHRVLNEGDIDAAEVAQRQLIVLLQTSGAEGFWRTKCEQAFLREIHDVSKLPLEKQKTYVAAYRQLTDAGPRVAVEDYASAEQLLEKAARGLTAAVGENHVSVAGTLEKLGTIGLMEENSAKAKQYLARAAAVWGMTLGKDHPFYANAVSLIGIAHLEAKDFKQAQIAFREALTLQRTLFGSEDIRYAESLGKLSRAIISAGDTAKLPEANVMCLQAIAIAERLQGPDCPLIASYAFNLADINISNSEYETAEKNLRRSLILYERSLPRSNVVLPRVLDRYAFVLKKLNRFDEAKAIDVRAEAMRGELRSARSQSVKELK